MNIVGVCGRANSGKDTVATHLVKHHHFKHLLLAAPLKEFAQCIFGFTDDQLYGSSHQREKYIQVERARVFEQVEQHGHFWLHTIGYPNAYQLLEEAIGELLYHHAKHGMLNARIALQYLGTEFGRLTLDQDVWVRTIIQEAKSSLTFDDFQGVVVSDVRFANEVEAIKHVGGRVIRLLRNSTTPIPGISNHLSELEQASIPITAFDCIINNTETLGDLYRSIDTFLLCNHPITELITEEVYERRH